MYRGVVQSVEHQSPKLGVQGSSPCAPAKNRQVSTEACRFFNEARLRRMKNEAGLRPMKRAFGLRRGYTRFASYVRSKYFICA